jgi:hypothetical protein
MLIDISNNLCPHPSVAIAKIVFAGIVFAKFAFGYPPLSAQAPGSRRI